LNICSQWGTSRVYPGTSVVSDIFNDIDKNIVNKLLKFADDTKLCGKVSSNSDIDQMQADLRQLFD